MKRTLGMLVIGGLIVAGCASSFGFRRQELFENSAKSYAHLIRWSEFEAARVFIAPDESGNLKPPPANVRITDYQVKQISPSDDMRKVDQVVEVTYFKVDAPRVTTLVDRQRWEFDPAREVWLLRSGFPDFR
jgi:hypothetical protein